MTAKQSVAHRGGIASRVQSLRPDQTSFDRIGGRETIERIVDGLYDEIEGDKAIRPMFVSHLEGERAK
jgi:truncated hemoglobin YjbI